ncbi:hypothetical protein ABEW34_31755 [Paenibacillus algorifonticola]
MEKDVDAALKQVNEQHGGKSVAEKEQYMKEMAKMKKLRHTGRDDRQ